MKFFCDLMLVRLGRWLRAAGYDVKMAGKSQDDSEILKEALEEKRILLTRDSHFLELFPSSESIIFLKSNTLRECAKELSQKITIEWLKSPFSRCLLCNSPLYRAKKNELKEVPSHLLQECQKFWFCPGCQKVYWQGSHTKRMNDTLKKWSEKIFD